MVCAVLLGLGFVLLQGCSGSSLSIKRDVRVFVQKKMEENSGPGVKPPLPDDAGKSPINIDAIPKGDPCLVSPFGPSCPLPDSIQQACPARPILDSYSLVGQETGSWCWAASVEGLGEAHGRDIKQCRIVTDVKGVAVDCCDPGSQNDLRCLKSGWPHQAFNHPTVRLTWDYVFEPLSVEQLAHLLCEYGPISFVIRADGGGGHSFVVFDLVSEEANKWMVYVDPEFGDFGGQTNLVRQFTKWSYEAFRDGEFLDWNSTNSQHYVDYINIQKNP